MSRIVVKRARDWRHGGDPWSRYVPEHTPIERSHVRLGDGFVLVGGWQVQYGWDPQHRRHVVVEMRQRHAARLRALAERKHCPAWRRAKLARKLKAA